MYWVRQELRLADNPCLREAAAAECLLPVLLQPKRGRVERPWWEQREGPFRRRFRAESVSAFASELERRGSGLFVCAEARAGALATLAASLQCSRIVATKLAGSDEEAEEQALQVACKRQGVSLHLLDGHTLFAGAQMAGAPADASRSFSRFRKGVEGKLAPAAPLAAPDKLPPLPALTAEVSKGLERFSPSHPFFAAELRQAQPYAHTFALHGAADAGQARMQWFIWESRCIRRYKETRNDPLAVDASSKFSPWLAQGALSAREVWAEIVRFEATHGSNASTYWLRFELLWREYFFWYARHHGTAIFASGGPGTAAVGPKAVDVGVRSTSVVDDASAGLNGERSTWVGRILEGLTAPQRAAFEAWTRGETDASFVNAAMRELRESGWLSNRSRQVAASYLAWQLGVDWRLGAAWFEYWLCDYDVASNWGNWGYQAAAHPRSDARPLDPEWQANAYDPDGAYRHRWLKQT